MSSKKGKLPDLAERFSKCAQPARKTDKLPEPIVRAPEGLLSKILRPKTAEQAQATFVLLGIIVALVAGIAGGLATSQSGSLFSETNDRVVAAPNAAITRLVEAECRGKPNADPSIYSGQENVAALKAACQKAASEE